MNTTPKPEQSTWRPIDGGTTIGQQGSEQGIIIREEEHERGARITLERAGCTAPFSITCGIYGLFVHTAFAANESEGLEKYVAMRQRLDEIIASPEHEVSSQLRAFADAF